MNASPRVALATVSAHLTNVEPGFRAAAELGYDGVEVMVGYHPDSRDPRRLNALAAQYDVPVVAVHSPSLLLTLPVWGADPLRSAERSVDLAECVGASTVIAHPPFTWQHGSSGFLDHVRHLEHRTGLTVAVENMYPWRFGTRTFQPYAPHWDPTIMSADHVTLDASHAAAAGQDSVEVAAVLGDRLAHVHLADGHTGRGDQHLVPGTGSQPLETLLKTLSSRSWSGIVSVELAAHPFRSAIAWQSAADALAFARRNLDPVTAA